MRKLFREQVLGLKEPELVQITTRRANGSVHSGGNGHGNGNGSGAVAEPKSAEHLAPAGD